MQINVPAAIVNFSIESHLDSAKLALAILPDGENNALAHGAALHAKMEPYFSSLAASARELIDLIGLESMLLLVDAYGGSDVNLYNSERSLGRMGATIGRANAELLLKRYGTTPFTVPMCEGLRRAVRNAGILAEFDRLTGEGVSARESATLISRRLIPKMHTRSVWRILKAPVPNMPYKTIVASPASAVRTLAEEREGEAGRILIGGKIGVAAAPTGSGRVYRNGKPSETSQGNGRNASTGPRKASTVKKNPAV
jgi:hypothetical protein